jgi:hypothetical protein
MLGVYPTGTPKHRVIGTASVRLPREIQLLATARYESGTITTNESGLILPASDFATADFGGIVPLYSGLDLRAGVKNLFDRNYYQKASEAGRNWYEPPHFLGNRTVTLHLFRHSSRWSEKGDCPIFHFGIKIMVENYSEGWSRPKRFRFASLRLSNGEIIIL